ncbi:MAG: GSCFA domain-containing protein [Rikenellaceae bacterium]
MNFRTQIEIPFFKEKIDLADSLFFIGSCFSDNIGNILSNNGFHCTINPYGATYNPLSICKILSSIEEKKDLDNDQIVESDGVFRSLLHHSFIYGNTKNELLNATKAVNIKAYEELKNSNYIIITLGTSWVFEYIKIGEIVNNCQKIPAKEFNRYELSIDDIVEAFSSLIEHSTLLHDKKIIFTLSPIRHLKDGLIGNSLSKATLRVAIDILSHRFSNIWYFPAYEIMMDDLRDYRFWERDMTHPSPVAIEYIFDIFKEALINKDCFQSMKEHEKAQKALAHRSIIKK